MEVGNLIAKLPATEADRLTLMLQSHMDTVKPGEGIEPVIEGNEVRSAGDSILGADANAGVVGVEGPTRVNVQVAEESLARLG